ncbi:hypothetical protein EFL38_10850 [Lactococcus cremoris]|nr:hypothetical protein [Lactococcus cremoris]
MIGKMINKLSDEEKFKQYKLFSNIEVLTANVESLSDLERSKETLKQTMIVGSWSLIERVCYENRNGICEFCGKRNLKWAFHIVNNDEQLSYMIGGDCLEKKTKILDHKTAVNKIESWESINNRIAKSERDFDKQIEEFVVWGLPKINVKLGSLGIDLEMKDIIEDLIEKTTRKATLGRLKTIAHNIGLND